MGCHQLDQTFFDVRPVVVWTRQCEPVASAGQRLDQSRAVPGGQQFFGHQPAAVRLLLASVTEQRQRVSDPQKPASNSMVQARSQKREGDLC